MDNRLLTAVRHPREALAYRAACRSPDRTRLDRSSPREDFPTNACRDL
jgi:hypothetical protein